MRLDCSAIVKLPHISVTHSHIGLLSLIIILHVHSQLWVLFYIIILLHPRTQPDKASTLSNITDHFDKGEKKKQNK